MKKYVSESEFREAMQKALAGVDTDAIDFVVGAGRSGAIASAYVSHMTGIPFVAWNNRMPENSLVMIVDTARFTGRTLRKAEKRYAKHGHSTATIFAFDCPDTHFVFWYERDYSVKATASQLTTP